MKFQKSLYFLVENNSIVSINTILKKSSKSINTTISYIRKKNTLLLNISLKIGSFVNITRRNKKAINKNLAKSFKKINKYILEENSLNFFYLKPIILTKRKELLY